MFPSLDLAMARFEGFGLPGTIATRNNNPGNLVYGSFAINHGAIGSDNGFATFPDVATGFGAMDSLLQSYANRGETLASAIAKWNGNGDNSPAYTNYVAGKTGVTPDTPLSSLDILGQLGLGNVVGKAAGAATDAVTGGVTSAVGTFFGISWTRIASFAIGLICVIIGLMSFKPVNDVVVTVKDKAVGAVKDAALAGTAVGA